VRLVTAARYAGSRVTCVLCGGRFRRFAGSGSLPNVRCPRCGSLPRHRLLWLYLEASGLAREAEAVLQVAPEPHIARRLRARGDLRYVSTDLEDPAADVRADLTALPFADAEFDLALCSHVLEHVVDDRAAMRELCRVLRPRGVALIASPVNYEQPGTFEDATVEDPAERLRLFSQPDHVRVYGPDLRDRLEDAGFAVEIVTPADLPGVTESEHRLVPRLGPLRNDLYRCVRVG
jgi:SAM-dependent methyltransferase